MMSDEIKDKIMNSIIDGGEIALSGFIKNMEEVKEKIGDQSYPISAFIEMAKDFKGVWLEGLTDKVNEL